MSRFKLHFQPVTLFLKQPFTISRGTKSEVQNVFVRVSADGITGYGEASPNTRYDEDAAGVMQFLEALPNRLFHKVDSPEELSTQLDSWITEQSLRPMQSARAAIEMAWLDWYAKKEGQPLWELWKAPGPVGPQTSYTIGVDKIVVMQQKVQSAQDFPILKVKLGTEWDKEIIKGLREITDKTVRVDANEGWTTVEEAAQMITFLADYGVELVEQPMPSDMVQEMKALKKISRLPLCADESFKGDENLEEIAEAFDIINIKLSKIGSMVKAREVIHRARELDLKVMIGCMIESSLANTAGAVLSLWADYSDLDGHLLIKEDPFKGLKLDGKKNVVLRTIPGLGVEKVD